MKIIFDCGSTKTAVGLAKDEVCSILEINQGYNAMADDDMQLFNLVTSSRNITEAAAHIREVHFYGAGCATDEACARTSKCLAKIFPEAVMNVNTDMLGAARAVCGDTPGIVGILGTGSNSCMYDGKHISDNVSPLGYILGDEGSGAVIGRLFLGRLLKRQFPPIIMQKFEEKYHLTTSDIITRVYRQPRANAFLASFAPFIHECADKHAEISQFLIEEFSRYVRYNLMQYPMFTTIPIHFIGSIATHFSKYIDEAVSEAGGHLGLIVKAPIERLTYYHSHSG